MSDDLDDAVFAPPEPGVPGPNDEWFTSSAAWVAGWLMTYSPKPARWCPQWADHPEAAARVHDLWQSWITAQTEGGAAPSSWWLYHHDGHLAALTDSRGPFARCTNGHTPSRPWSTDADPPGP